MRVRLSKRWGLLAVAAVFAIYSAFWGLMWKAADPCWNRSGIMIRATGDEDRYNRILRNLGEPPLNACEPGAPDYMRFLVVGGYQKSYLVRLEPDPDRPRLIFKTGRVDGANTPKEAVATDEFVLSKEEWRQLLDFLAGQDVFRPPSAVWRVTTRSPPRSMVVEVLVDGHREIRSMGKWFGPDYQAIDDYFDGFFDRNARCGFDEDGVWYCSGWHIRKIPHGL